MTFFHYSRPRHLHNHRQCCHFLHCHRCCTLVQACMLGGDLVGIQSYHPPNGDVRYPTDSTFYWFSLSGPCPNLPSGKKTSSNCTKYEKGLVPSSKSQYVSGGLCNRIFKSNIPDGTPGCSYYVENFTAKKLDSIVGIKEQDCGGRQCADWQDFRLHCSNTNLSFTHLGVKYCKEYDFPGCLTSCQDSACHAENEVGLPFWTGRCNASRNSDRASAIKEAFGGSIVDLYYAHNPSCDKYGPMCNKPVPDAGVSYCHRDGSGVCDACYVPGTANPPSPRPAAQVPCRVDLFLNKKMPQYKANGMGTVMHSLRVVEFQGQGCRVGLQVFLRHFIAKTCQGLLRSALRRLAYG